MRYLITFLMLLCVGCGSYSNNVPTLKPYKLDIQQGNVVTSKMLMQLRPGMTRSQVRFVMGTPLLVDSFHSDRWDYFYQLRKDGKIIDQRRVILDFDGDSLTHVRGDIIPVSADSIDDNLDQPTSTEPRVITKPAAKEKGLLDKLKFWDDDENVNEKDSEQTANPVEPVMQDAEKSSMPDPEGDLSPAEEMKQEAVASDDSASEPSESELPEEGTPNFFEKMLEKIGF